MSEQLPIVATPSPQPSSNKAPASPVSKDHVSDGKQKEFGGVLSDQVQKNGTDKAKALSTDKADKAKAVLASTDLETENALPEDGNALPLAAELLKLANSKLDAELVDAEQVVESELLIEDAALAATSTAAAAAVVVVNDAKPVASIGLNLSNEKPAPAVKLTPATVVATIAGEASDDSAPVEAATQLRRAENIEGKVISLAARDDIQKTALQTNKIMEQFSEASAKPTAAINNVSAAVPASMPILTNSAVSASPTGLQQVSIEVPVQHQQWQKAFAERVVWSVGNNQSVQVKLNPAELGPIDIHIKVTKDHANITFNTSNITTRDNIESALPRLREMLAGEGLNLGDVDVRHNDSSAQEQKASQDQNNDDQSARLGTQEQDEENQTQTLLHPVMISERAIDYYI